MKHIEDNYHSFLYMLQCNYRLMKVKSIDDIVQVTKSFRLAICLSKLAVQIEMEKAFVYCAFE